MILLIAGVVSASPGPNAGRLGSENFRDREDALRELWEQGMESEALLREHAASDDPEVAWRARQVLQLLELKLAPDTSPRIVKLVESFLHAKSINEREDAFSDLLELAAYPQLIRLPRQLAKGETRDNYQRRVDSIVSEVAREMILEGKDQEALALIGESRESTSGNLRWIALASAMGLREELTPELDRDDQMRFARWAGDVATIQELASEDHEIQATLQIINGDPIPFLQKLAKESTKQSMWARLAIQLWENQEDEDKIRSLIADATVIANEEYSNEANEALHLLGRLGFAEFALPLFEKTYPDDTFCYYHTRDQIDKALACYGLVVGGETDAKWISENLKLVGEEWDLENPGCRRLINVALSLYEHGERAKSEVILRALGDRIGEIQDNEEMLNYLGYLAGGGNGRGAFSDGVQQFSTGFPELALTLAEEEGGLLFQPSEFLRLTFNSRETAFTFYSYLRKTHPEMNDWKRVRIVFAAFGLEVDVPREEVIAYLDTYEKEIAEDKNSESWEVLRDTALWMGDVARLERFFAAEVARDPESIDARGNLAFFYFANKDFAKAAEIWGKIQQDSPDGLSHDFYCYLVVSLTMSGQEEAAEVPRLLLEKISLGDGRYLATMADLWSQCGQRERAYQCEKRALLLLPSESRAWQFRIQNYAAKAQESGHWMTAAAAKQILAASPNQEFPSDLGVYLAPRAEIEYNLAMAAFETGLEDEGQRRLAKSVELGGHESFFANEPLWQLRKMGRFEELHQIWGKLGTVYRRAIEAYPNSDNTLNTAAWAAARSGKDTGEAMTWIDRALVLRPAVSAYLDTKAEVFFAQGRREEALVWSDKACQKARGVRELAEIRLQQKHFAEDDFYLPPAADEKQPREVSE